jgi:hypothetical protein
MFDFLSPQQHSVNSACAFPSIVNARESFTGVWLMKFINQRVSPRVGFVKVFKAGEELDKLRLRFVFVLTAEELVDPCLGSFELIHSLSSLNILSSSVVQDLQMVNSSPQLSP